MGRAKEDADSQNLDWLAFKRLANFDLEQLLFFTR